MTSRRLLWSALGAVAVLAMIGGGWIVSLPPTPVVAAAPAIAQQETDATIAALKPPKRQRPLIAIVGINDATETTDYLMPYGILKRADVADVVTLATVAGPMTLFPALKVEPQATVAEFDAQHPDGADYVIVPRMSRDDDPAALQWIRNQSAKGAISSAFAPEPRSSATPDCCTASGRPPTGIPSTSCAKSSHDPLRGRPPSGGRRGRSDDDRNYGVDADVAHADRGDRGPGQGGGHRPRHRSRQLGCAARKRRVQVHASVRADRDRAIPLAFWNREQLGIELRPGVDEVSLALVADAWSRTYRSRAMTFAGTADAQREPQRHPHSSRSGRGQLARDAVAAGDRAYKACGRPG